MLIRLFFKRIIKEPVQSRYLMLLQDNQERYLQIYVGEREGETVASWKESIKPPRPMTYDLISSILNLSDNVVLTKILIDGCSQDVFYAKMFFNVNGEEKVIDCRPSDAIAVGLRMNVPIYAESCVLEKHGLVII
ncbi:MAG: bifunctional nuclease family protein [Mucispirillum sp.]|nr:bifunctional nuclease family protein [Mucispirillum sp.]